jgi:hypothetical protein
MAMPCGSWSCGSSVMKASIVSLATSITQTPSRPLSVTNASWPSGVTATDVGEEVTGEPSGMVLTSLVCVLRTNTSPFALGT